MKLPKIYPILSNLATVDEYRLQALSLFEAGAGLLQIREKFASSRVIYDVGIEVKRCALEFDAKVIINDRIDLAIACNADGVHLGQTDLDPRNARKFLGDDKLIGFSTHNKEQADFALTCSLDYFAIGPVFPTATKRDADPTVGLQLISELKEKYPNSNLVAIGGITPNKINSTLFAGADSVALISSLYKDGLTIGQQYLALEQMIENKHC